MLPNSAVQNQQTDLRMQAPITSPKRKKSLFKKLVRLPGKAVLPVALVILLTFTIVAAFPQTFATFDPTVNRLPDRLQSPGSTNAQGDAYILGTDHLGRDVWSRLVWGARASLLVGYSGVLLGGLSGIFIGLISGFYGGWIDRILMRIVDIYLSFPYILIAIVWASLVGTTITSLILIIAVRGWVEFARVVRGQVLALKEREYVLAARSLGASPQRIMFRHLLPNTVSPILIIAGFQLGRLILLEATLSFLTIGIRPPTPAWGTMLSEARQYIRTAWWTVLYPGLAISSVVLAANFLGDGLRDRLDSSLRNRR